MGPQQQTSFVDPTADTAVPNQVLQQPGSSAPDNASSHRARGPASGSTPRATHQSNGASGSQDSSFVVGDVVAIIDSNGVLSPGSSPSELDTRPGAPSALEPDVHIAGAQGSMAKSLSRVYTNFITRRPVMSLMLFLVPSAVLSTFALTKTITFDVGVEAFQVQDTHFSQQRQHALESALKAERSVHSFDRDAHDFWAEQPAGRRHLQVFYERSKRALVPDVPMSNLMQVPRSELLAREAAEVLGRLEIIFSRKDGGNIVTPTGISQVRSIEKLLEGIPGYSYFCILNSAVYGERMCAPATSVTTYFYPSIGVTQLKYDGRGDRIVDFNGTATALRQFSLAAWFVEEDFHRTGRSSLLRTEIAFAHESAVTDAGRLRYERWLANNVLPTLETIALNCTQDIEITYGGDDITQYIVMETLWADLHFAVFSFILVMIYTTAYLRSVFLGTTSLGMIGLSFPLALFGNSVHANTITLGVLNILSVYVILGIGVDDVYVFCNAFSLPQAHIPLAELEERFHVAVLRAGKAMFLTSLTTAMAFLGNLVASIPVIISFAKLMATLVAINFIFIVTIWPTIYMIYLKHVIHREEKLWCFFVSATVVFLKTTTIFLPCQSRAPRTAPRRASSRGNTNHFNNTVNPISASESLPNGHSNDHDNGAIVNNAIVEDVNQSDTTVQSPVLPTKLAHIVTQKPRLTIILTMLIASLASVFAAQLQPSQRVPQLFDDGSMLQRFLDLKNVNLTGTGHCDTCAAATNPDFHCDSNSCPVGQTCKYGVCYDDSGSIMLSCPQEISAVMAQCSSMSVQSLGFLPGGAFVSSMMNENVLSVLLPGFGSAEALQARGSCVDTYKMCSQWAAYGDCISAQSQSFMEHYCRFSCGLCGMEVETGLECFDDVDNDSDHLVDCNDPDCIDSLPYCTLSDDDRQMLAHGFCEQSQRGDMSGSHVLSCRDALQSFSSTCNNPSYNAAVDHLNAVIDCRQFSFRWITEPTTFLPCPSECGHPESTQTRVVTCVAHDGIVVPSRRCEALGTPADTLTCKRTASCAALPLLNPSPTRGSPQSPSPTPQSSEQSVMPAHSGNGPVTYSWITDPETFQRCPNECGMSAFMQIRSVVCQGSNENGLWVVEASMCDYRLKPGANMTCAATATCSTTHTQSTSDDLSMSTDSADHTALESSPNQTQRERQVNEGMQTQTQSASTGSAAVIALENQPEGGVDPSIRPEHDESGGAISEPDHVNTATAVENQTAVSPESRCPCVHGACRSGSSICVCSPLYQGAHCDACTIPGLVYPNCGVSANLSPADDVASIANENKINIHFVFGLKPSVEKHDVATQAGFAPKVEFGPPTFYRFDIFSPGCQEDVINVCEYFRANYKKLKLQPVVRCWIAEFQRWLSAQQNLRLGDEGTHTWTIDELQQWLSTVGSDFNGDVGFDRTESVASLAWFRITVYSAELPRYAAGFQALPFFRTMESVAKEISSNSRSIIHHGTLPMCLRSAPVFQTSDLWPRVFTEVTAVNGTIYAIIVIVVLASWSILLFTNSIRAAGAIMFAVAVILVSILAVFNILGWTLGIVEAISISILLGSSVDYSLHIAEAYMDQVEKLHDLLPNCEMRTVVAQMAVADVGQAVLHAAITTILSVGALNFCQVIIFQRFGLIILISVCFSIAASMTLLPALLATFGPTQKKRLRSNTWTDCLVMTASRAVMGLSGTLAFLGVLVLTLYGVDRICVSNGCRVLGPEGTPLFDS